jgi:hypothetical protein
MVDIATVAILRWMDSQAQMKKAPKGLDFIGVFWGG